MDVVGSAITWDGVAWDGCGGVTTHPISTPSHPMPNTVHNTTRDSRPSQLTTPRHPSLHLTIPPSMFTLHHHALPYPPTNPTLPKPASSPSHAMIGTHVHCLLENFSAVVIPLAQLVRVSGQVTGDKHQTEPENGVGLGRLG